jgi:hypothetical protein
VKKWQTIGSVWDKKKESKSMLTDPVGLLHNIANVLQWHQLLYSTPSADTVNMSGLTNVAHHGVLDT